MPDTGDAAADAVLVLGAFAHKVGTLAAGISPDDEKVGRRGEALVADAGRDEHRVAGPTSGLAVLAAESDLGLTRGDAQHFVGGGVVVGKGKMPFRQLPPQPLPRNNASNADGRVASRWLDRAGIDDHRQRGLLGMSPSSPKRKVSAFMAGSVCQNSGEV